MRQFNLVEINVRDIVEIDGVSYLKVESLSAAEKLGRNVVKARLSAGRTLHSVASKLETPA